jgi:transketolase
VRVSRSATPLFYQPGACQFKLGKGSVLREGKDAAIIACGIMVYEADKACQILEKEGIHCRLINMASISPIDTELLVDTAKKCGKIVTAEEHSIVGGLGSAVAEVLAETVPCKMRRIGVRKHCLSGKPEELMVFHNLTAEDIVDAVKSLL